MKSVSFRVFLSTILLAITIPSSAGLKDVEPFDVAETRNLRFCEVILVMPGGAEAYNSTGLNDCPVELWKALDEEKLKADRRAQFVVLNGPKFWMMDEQTLWFGGTDTFGGIGMKWAATLPAAGLEKEGGKPYQVFKPEKHQKMVYMAGKKVYELVDPDGYIYVLQARTGKVSMEMLESLGEHMKELPEGWSYRVRVLEKELVLDLNPEMTIFGVGDEFHQYYTRIP